MNIRKEKTDVLVVGGGIAGWMAADHAKQTGAKVILADKGYVGKSGQSPYARSIYNYDPEKGKTIKELADFAHKCGEYLTNRYWSELTIQESATMVNELRSWGIEFGEMRYKGGSSFSIVGSSATGYVPFKDTFGNKARTHLEKIGIDLMDRVMIVELILQDGRVAGAVGIDSLSEEIVCIYAGAVILCTGATTLKSPGFPCAASLTGDGERMAYEAGAFLAGKEFVQPMRAAEEKPWLLGSRGLEEEHPLSGGRNQKGIGNSDEWIVEGKPYVKREGHLSNYKFSYLELEFLQYEGRGPVVTRGNGLHVNSGAALGMCVRKSEGLWPADYECRSNVEGLFAAGDSLCTMQNGTLYQLGGAAMSESALTGAIAGEAAAKFALEIGSETVDDLNADKAVNKTLKPYERAGGYNASWIIHQIQNIYSPYYVSLIKKEDRLNAAIFNLKFISDILMPKIMATNIHELRLAHEARSIALTTELRLRSALFRTESRGMHYREDYPYRDDENWLCWTKASCRDGHMTMEKEFIPEEWKPSDELTYAEKYPFAFPGEAERGLR